MNKFVCIHGHFYQPPRENPWLEYVELQDSAYPFHDWNEKINHECYSQNAVSRILDSRKKIIDIVNNYSKISFDFGPTLLSWLKKNQNDLYQAILDADKQGQKIFSGHGPAIAQAYNHIIMPLANKRDKETQVIWGIKDFEKRFCRKPEGMWLPETAVDIETLEVLADNDIDFTVLAPHQAAKIRKINTDNWQNVNQDSLDTTVPYLCNLPSGNKINLFFYHGPVSHDVAYGSLLKSGDKFAKSLIDTMDDNPEHLQLANIATDGETYGHHHRHADMALAFCLSYIEKNKLATPTIYAEFLEKSPPQNEVEINENTSWSCSHGIERWRSNCGCFYGRYPSGKQQFRGPLREAMNHLRDKTASVYEKQMNKFSNNPWEIRNEYIQIINDRSYTNIEKFISNCIKKKITDDEKVILLKLLELQRNAMLMFTSCGWFFDDICGIETLQILQYASRAIQLTKEISGDDPEPEFVNILKKAQVNEKNFKNGKDAYEKLIKSSAIDLNRVAAHLAVSSIFEQKPKDNPDIYCYTTDIEAYKQLDAGIQTLATGRASVQSKIVLEKHIVDFAVLHLGDHNLVSAVTPAMNKNQFSKMQENLETAFRNGNTTEVMRLMNVAFNGNNYSLWHLFKDDQRHILYELLDTTWKEIDASFRHIYEHNCTVMEMMHGMKTPLPKALSLPAEFIINQDISKIIQSSDTDIEQLKTLITQAKRLSLNLDKTKLNFEATRKMNRLAERLKKSPNSIDLLVEIKATLKPLRKIAPRLDLQKAQNILFELAGQKYRNMNKKAKAGDDVAKKWIKQFDRLAKDLKVKITQKNAD